MKTLFAIFVVSGLFLTGCANDARIIEQDGDERVVVQFGSPREARKVANKHCDQFGKNATLRRSETASGSGEIRVYQCVSN